MKWCRFHLRWEIWLGDKLVAWVVGDASEAYQLSVYRQVVDLVLDGHQFVGLAHPTV